MQKKNSKDSLMVEELSSVMGFSKEDASKLLTEFYQQAVQSLAYIKKDFQEDNLDELADHAHQLKGMACSMRMEPIQDVARAIEKNQGVRVENIAKLEQLLNEFGKEE